MFGRNRTGRRAATERSLEGLVDEIGKQRTATRELLARFEREADASHKAVAAAAKAREERDEYRRVLAAAIGGEHREAARVAELQRDRERLEGVARDAAHKLGEASARHEEVSRRVRSLESELESERQDRERALADAADRAWSEREAAREEMVKLVATSRRESASIATEVRAAIREAHAEHRALVVATERGAALDRIERIRVRAALTLAVVATLIGVALLPATVLAMLDAERAAYLHLATHLTPAQLMLSTTVCLGGAVVLLSIARRSVQPRSTRPEAPTNEETETVAEEAASPDETGPEDTEPGPDSDVESEAESSGGSGAEPSGPVVGGRPVGA